MISLGVDIGGTGCKCVAFREDGTQLALAYAEYPLEAGQATLPPALLTDSVFQVIGDCVRQLDGGDEVRVITVSSFGESFVAVDAQGEALADISLYFANGAHEEFTRLVRRIGEGEFMETARIFPDASYSLCGMLSTQKTAPRPVRKYLFVAGYICYRLTGEACTDESLACRSLLYDVHRRCWAEELARQCGIDPATLPRVLPTGGKVGGLLPQVAAQLGLSPAVQVVMGAHDQIANALGAGVENVGDAVDTSGTCECITPLFEQIPQGTAFQEDRFACVPYPEDRGYVTYAYNISAGSVVRWFRDALAYHMGQETRSVYDVLNECCPREPTQLLVLPFLQGMGGTPEVDANATGLIAGITTKTRLPDIYRALLEGITFEMRYNQEKLKEYGIDLRRLYACGGGAGSPVWLQIKADILGCQIIPVRSGETGAMGSAILGIAAVTGKSPLTVARNFRQYETPVCPIPEHQAVYEKKYQMYKTLRQLYTEHRGKEGG